MFLSASRVHTKFDMHMELKSSSNHAGLTALSLSSVSLLNRPVLVLNVYHIYITHNLMYTKHQAPMKNKPDLE